MHSDDYDAHEQLKSNRIYYKQDFEEKRSYKLFTFALFIAIGAIAAYFV